jgi:hypothetical protein
MGEPLRFFSRRESGLMAGNRGLDRNRAGYTDLQSNDVSKPFNDLDGSCFGRIAIRSSRAIAIPVSDNSRVLPGTAERSSSLRVLCEVPIRGRSMS